MFGFPEKSRKCAQRITPDIVAVGVLKSRAEAEKLVARLVETLVKARLIGGPPVSEPMKVAIDTAHATLSGQAAKVAPRVAAELLAEMLGHLLAQDEQAVLTAYSNKQCPPDSQPWCDLNRDQLNMAQRGYDAALNAWGVCVAASIAGSPAGPGLGLPGAAPCTAQMMAIASAFGALDLATRQAAFACNTFCGMPSGK